MKPPNEIILDPMKSYGTPCHHTKFIWNPMKANEIMRNLTKSYGFRTNILKRLNHNMKSYDIQLDRMKSNDIQWNLVKSYELQWSPMIPCQIPKARTTKGNGKSKQTLYSKPGQQRGRGGEGARDHWHPIYKVQQACARAFLFRPFSRISTAGKT